jgi:hypothetical protein
MRIASSLAVFLMLNAVAANAELLPAGPQVSISTEHPKPGQPAVAHFADGRAVVVWLEAETEGCCGQEPMVGRIYNSDGTAAGPEFPLGTLDRRGNQPLRVRVVPPGDRFVVVRDFGDPVAPIWRLYDQTGAPLGAEVTVPVAGDVESYGVAVDTNGNLAILYREQLPPDTDSWEFRIQRYTMAGAAVGAPTIVDSSSSAEFLSIGFEPASDGTLVVGWVRYDGESPTGLVRRYDATGAAVGSDFMFAGPYADGYVSGTLTTDGAGHIYTAFRHVISPSTIKRFALDGSGGVDYPLVESDHPFVMAMRATPDGRLVVVWRGDGDEDYYSPNGWLTVFAADGSTEGPAVPLGDSLGGRRFPNGLSTNVAGSALVALVKLGVPIGGWIDVELQRFCDTNDAGCDLCPGFDEVDSDGDFIPDGCDPCSNVAGSQDATASKAMVSFAYDAFFPYTEITLDNKMSLQQTFVLPAGSSFGTLTVMSEGARIRVESVRGQALFDATLPGGAYAGPGTRGWSATTTKLKYSDRTDSPINGVTQLTIVDENSKQSGQVRVKARAWRGEYGVYETNLPMTTIVLLGDEEASADGVCGEFPFALDQCDSKFKLVSSIYRSGKCRGRVE